MTAMPHVGWARTVAHEEKLQKDRYAAGTSGHRQRPRRSSKLPSGLLIDDSNTFIDRVMNAVRTETSFERDAFLPHRWKEGEALTLIIDGQPYRAEVALAFEFMGRLRYRLAFANGAHMMLTEKQISSLLKPETVLSAANVAAVEALLELDAFKRGSRRTDIRRRKA